MIHAAAFSESIVAPALFQLGFLHSLGHERTLTVPKEVWHCLLATLCEKLIKIGAKVDSHGRYASFRLAKVVLPKGLLQNILNLIVDLR